MATSEHLKILRQNTTTHSQNEYRRQIFGDIADVKVVSVINPVSKFVTSPDNLDDLLSQSIEQVQYILMDEEGLQLPKDLESYVRGILNRIVHEVLEASEINYFGYCYNKGYGGRDEDCDDFNVIVDMLNSMILNKTVKSCVSFYKQYMVQSRSHFDPSKIHNNPFNTSVAATPTIFPHYIHSGSMMARKSEDNNHLFNHGNMTNMFSIYQ